MRHAPDRCARCGPHAEDHTDPRAGALHAVQGLFAGEGLSVQTVSLGCTAAAKDFSERSTVNVVARRKMI